MRRRHTSERQPATARATSAATRPVTAHPPTALSPRPRDVTQGSSGSKPHEVLSSAPAETRMLSTAKTSSARKSQLACTAR